MGNLRLPRRLYLYIGQELLQVFLLSLAALTFLFMIIIGLRGVAFGLGMSTVATFVAESLGMSFFFTVPVSLLLSGTLTYGRMVSDREYTAMTASGLSPLHVFAPLGLMSLLLMGIAYLAHGSVLPDAHYAQRNFARFLIKQLEDLGDQRDGQIPLDDGGSISWREVRDGKYLEGVRISKNFLPGDIKNPDYDASSGSHPGQPLPLIVHAQYATIELGEANRILLILDGVEVKVADSDRESRLFDNGWSKAWHGFRVSHHTLEFDLEQQDRRYADLHNSDLLAEVDTMQEQRKTYVADIENAQTEEDRAQKEQILGYHDSRIRKYLAEYWQRKAMVLSVFTFAFLSFPISLVLRYRHRLVSLFAGAVIVVTVFYPLLLLGVTLSEDFAVAPFVAMMSGNIVILAISAILTGRVLVR